jgi:putative ABC transport system substrate-binding protein
MKRRDFVGVVGATIASVSGVFAQQTLAKIWRVSYLYPGSLDNPADRKIFDVFRDEMRTLGYIEGKNYLLDSRSADGKIERLPALVGEMIALRPDVFVAIATPAIAAAQRATSTIPIVMAPATDPVGSGFVKSLAHPGGNITGMANMNGDSVGKTVELLCTIVPGAKRIAVLMSSNTTHPWQYRLAESAIKKLGLVAVPIKAPTEADLEPAFEEMKQESCDALFVLADPTRPTIVSLAAKFNVPAIYQNAIYVEMGGLLSYGSTVEPIFRKVAHYVDEIFKGADPAELPVEQPIVFELAINLKTAATLGLTIPDSVVARADRVIE